MSNLTMNNHPSDLFQRHKLNPILTAANWPYRVNSIFNPGATLLPDGTTLLLCRVEDRSGHSAAHMWISYSLDLRSWVATKKFSKPGSVGVNESACSLASGKYSVKNL